MKRNVKKIVMLILAFSLVFSVFALSACGPRELDDVEKSLVGKWTLSGKDCIFNEDGTTDYNTHHEEFKHIGDGTDPERGHYEIIQWGDYAQYVLFDSDKNSLYHIRRYEESGGGVGTIRTETDFVRVIADENAD